VKILGGFMKILQVSNFFKPSWETGGVTRTCYDLSKSLVANGHEVTVYTTDGYASRLKVPINTAVNVDGINVYYFYNIFRGLVKKMKFPIPYYAPFVSSKKIKNFDIIHIHEHRTLLAIVVSYYAKKYNIPYVIQAHGSVLPFIQNQKFKKVFDATFGNNMLHDASKVIALTEYESEQYLQMGVNKSKICIIPNGLNLKEYEKLSNKGVFKQKNSFSNNERIILYLGRIDKIKGIDLLIEAFSDLINELNYIRLVIVGPESNYLPILKKQTTDFGINDKVLFMGPLYGSNKIEAYIDADIYVLPSRYETFPNTVLEACVCGTPIIVTDRCGISDIVKVHKLGCVVKFDKEMLKCALSKVLSTNFKNTEFCNRAQIVKDNFGWSTVSQKVENIYRSVAK